MKIKVLYQKYRDIIVYGFFGVLTTLINIVVYWIAAHLLEMGTMPSTVLAWILAVLFAYSTNRKWVFHSKAITVSEIGKEIIYFFICRLTTGVIDWICMFIFVNLLGLYDVAIKGLSNILVILLNYVASKMIIFKNKN